MTQVNSLQLDRPGVVPETTERNRVTASATMAGEEVDNSVGELRHRVQQFLSARGIRDMQDVHVDVDGGIVVLRGRIASAHDRWLCVSCSSRVAGVRRVVDELQVGEDGAGRRRPM